MANGLNWIDIQTEVFIWQYIKRKAGSVYWYTSPLLGVLLPKSFSDTVYSAFPTFLWSYFWLQMVQAAIHNMRDGNVWLEGCIQKHIKQKHNNAWRP